MVVVRLEDMCDRRDNEGRIAYRRELDESDPVGVGPGDLPSRLQRQSRLAAPARSRQRDET